MISRKPILIKTLYKHDLLLPIFDESNADKELNRLNFCWVHEFKSVFKNRKCIYFGGKMSG